MSENPYEKSSAPQPPAPQYQQQYQQAPVYMQNSPEQMQGQQHAQTSMILGILSLFFIGIILGPIAISKAKKAEQMNVAATAGKVTGWIGTIMGIISIISIVIMIIITVSAAGTLSQM